MRECCLYRCSSQRKEDIRLRGVLGSFFGCTCFSFCAGVALESGGNNIKGWVGLARVSKGRRGGKLVWLVFVFLCIYSSG